MLNVWLPSSRTRWQWALICTMNIQFMYLQKWLTLLQPNLVVLVHSYQLPVKSLIYWIAVRVIMFWGFHSAKECVCTLTVSCSTEPVGPNLACLYMHQNMKPQGCFLKVCRFSPLVSFWTPVSPNPCTEFLSTETKWKITLLFNFACHLLLRCRGYQMTVCYKFFSQIIFLCSCNYFRMSHGVTREE